MKKIGFLLLLIIALPAIAGAVQPSFDCSKAAHPVEKMICNSDELAQLDSELSVLYKKLQNKYGHNIIKFYQQDWLEVRNRCNDFQCLLKSYEERVDEFKSLEAKRMDREGVWDVRLNNAYNFSVSRNKTDYIITYKNNNTLYNHFIFLKTIIKISNRNDRLNKLFREDLTEIYPISSLNNEYIKFVNGNSLSQFRVYGGSRCRGLYDDSDNFLITYKNGEKDKKILTMLLDNPIKVKGYNYCPSDEFDIMTQRVLKVYPFNIYDLNDETILIIINDELGNKNKGNEDYAIRFYSNLLSKSDLFGKKIFWLDVEDYIKIKEEFKREHGFYTRKQEDEMIYKWIIEQRGGIE